MKSEEADPEVIVLEEEDVDHVDKPIVVRVPRTPTEKEREEHEATHLPHAEWCEFCMRGRGRNKAHRRKKTSREEKTIQQKDKKMLLWQEEVELIYP